MQRMTISNQTDVFEIYRQGKSLCSVTERMKRQKSFEDADTSIVGLSDSKVSRGVDGNMNVVVDAKARRSGLENINVAQDTRINRGLIENINLEPDTRVNPGVNENIDPEPETRANRGIIENIIDLEPDTRVNCRINENIDPEPDTRVNCGQIENINPAPNTRMNCGIFKNIDPEPNTKVNHGIIEKPKVESGKEVSREENTNIERNKDRSNRDINRSGQNRSSQIFDWLSDPENQFMFQDGSPDGHVFRSNSAVQARPSAWLVKNTLYSSLREQDSKIKREALNGLELFNCKVRNTNETSTSGLRKEKKSVVDLRLQKSKSNLFIRSKSVDCLLESSEEIGGSEGTSSQISQGSIASASNSTSTTEPGTDEVFCTEDRNNSELEKQFDKMSIERDSLFRHDNSQSVTQSLPSLTKSKRRGKLRRINSDALFYKDTYRDGDDKQRKKKYGKRGKSLSFQLNSIIDEDASIGKQKFSILDINTEKLLSKLNEVILRGDVTQVRELADHGFDFNAKDNKGNCALHYAALRGSEDIINEILDHGGSVWIRNSDNQLPVELASNMNVRMLLSRVTLFYKERNAGQVESHLMSKGMSFEL